MEAFGFARSFNECNLDCGTDLETLRDLTSVSSDHYADLASHYSQVMDECYPPKKSVGVDNWPFPLGSQFSFVEL
jgi:hypothetical protein